MKYLPSSIVLEKNKFATTSAWLILLTVTLPDTTVIRLVKNNEDVTYGGNLFTAFDFDLEPVAIEMKGKLPSVNIRVNNVGRVFQSYVEEQEGIVGSTVLIQVVNSALLAQDFSELDLTFEIQKATADSQYVTFELGVPSPLHKRFPLYRYGGIICNWVSRFKGAECKYVKTRVYLSSETYFYLWAYKVHSFKKNETITFNNSDGSYVAPLDGTTTFYVIPYNTTLFQIATEADGAPLTGLSFGTGFTFFIKSVCDGRLETCQGLANSRNYGGFLGLGKGGVRFAG